jgi:Flp pilus assembly protein TadG
VRLRPFKHLHILARACTRAAQRLAGDRRGNFGLIFGLLAVPVVLSVGCSLDYVRTYNIKVQMQSDLDSALISAVKGVDSLNEAQIKQRVKDWFNAQSADGSTQYALTDSDITVDKATRAITATAKATIPTTLLGIINIPTVNARAKSAVTGPASSYLNVYIVIDKSASMLLAATSSGQTAMRNSSAGCVFACHNAEAGSHLYKGTYYANNYLLSRAMGVTLRADVAATAATNVLDLVAAADPTQAQIKVGLYTLGETATQELAPTTSLSTVRSKLATNAMTAATAFDYSFFDQSLPALTSLVGAAGDGKTSATPLKLVLILTDGVQSKRDWVLNGPTANVAPLNPAWCSSMKSKTNKVTVGVLYTEYLPMTWDWGYNATVGANMSSWASTFTAVMRAGVPTSTTRQAYIPYALTDCASAGMYLSAASQPAIEAGLSTLFKQYIGSVRLTQ